MESYAGWRIIHRIDDSAIGWTDANVDRYASANRYLELATKAIEREYPGADVTAEYGPYTRPVDVYGPGSDDEAREEEIRRDVEYLTSREFEDGDWAVETASA